MAALFILISEPPSRLNECEGRTKGVDGRTRPASIGDKETVYERDALEEFAAIEEEDSDDVKDNKNSG